jgi:hypothetical protein
MFNLTTGKRSVSRHLAAEEILSQREKKGSRSEIYLFEECVQAKKQRG